MLRVFQDDLLNPGKFVVTLELVPGRESTGRSVDMVMGIAQDAFSDGRICAVSITDNPGGNPSLSPDVIGHKIFTLGMDVIVHFTCRDMNRVGMESRALQLAMMGMKNILALTGDFAGRGFGGQGAPVFDLDSVNLQIMLSLLNRRIAASGDPDGFFTGCAVSPFKKTEGECFAQYAKLSRKAASGANFMITQLGYDARKFQELMLVQQHMGIDLPALGSIYLLTPGAARIMNNGKVPGAVVTDSLLKRVENEWKDKKTGRKLAIERAARLGSVLKGIGYRGIHIGGIHKDFSVAGEILDRMKKIQGNWMDFLQDFNFPQKNGFYAFDQKGPSHKLVFGKKQRHISGWEQLKFQCLRKFHDQFFSLKSPLAPVSKKICEQMDKGAIGRLMMHLAEHPAKLLLLGCRQCGDCAIQHVGFLCPESGCPKHTRNGACGGSLDGMCEVHPDRQCVWFRAHNRLASIGKTDQLCDGCVPPRMWELDHTSSWLNFHLGRDHQGASNEIADFCRKRTCRLVN